MPRIRLCGPVAIAAAATLLTFGIIPATHASAPGPPFTQCPAVGADTGCALLIDVDASGHVGVSQDPTQGPFDRMEDTLIGVVNESSTPLASLFLSSGTDIFGFDGDGICAAGTIPKPAACPFGSTGYEGPGTSFSDISSNSQTGVVHFSPAIQQGGTAYFSLEERLGLVAPDNVLTGPPNSGAIKKISDSASEPVVAVDPTNPMNIVVAYNHYKPATLFGPSAVPCGYSISTNGGADWSEGQDLELPADPSGQITGRTGDPALAFTRSGKLYFSCMVGSDVPPDPSTGNTKTLAIYLAIMDKVGKKFSTPKIVARGTNIVARDQEQLAASPVDDSVYMCFSDTVSTPSPSGKVQTAIFLARLDATGNRVATGSVTAGFHENNARGCTVGVAGSGRVWVGWWNIVNEVQAPLGKVWYAKDSLAEVAYSDLASTQNPIPFTGHTVLGPKNGIWKTDPNFQGIAEAPRHVWVKPSPVQGDNRAQSVWEDDSTTHDLRAASFNGSAWSPNTSIFHNVYQPALSWAADGAAVGFYQDSSSPARATSLLYTVARINNNQLSALHTVANTPSNAISNLTPFGRFADYASITSANGTISAAWTDNSSGQQTVWFGH